MKIGKLAFWSLFPGLFLAPISMVIFLFNIDVIVFLVSIFIPLGMFFVHIFLIVLALSKGKSYLGKRSTGLLMVYYAVLAISAVAYSMQGAGQSSPLLGVLIIISVLLLLVAIVVSLVIDSVTDGGKNSVRVKRLG